LQAEPVSDAKEAIQSSLVGDAPLTDLPPESLVDTETPLKSQPDVQNTLETQQQHSAVYSPGVNEAPEQTPDQIAAISSTAVQSKAPGQDKWLSKHSKQDKQQEGLAKALDKQANGLESTPYGKHQVHACSTLSRLQNDGKRPPKVLKSLLRGQQLLLFMILCIILLQLYMCLSCTPDVHKPAHITEPCSSFG